MKSDKGNESDGELDVEPKRIGPLFDNKDLIEYQTRRNSEVLEVVPTTGEGYSDYKDA